MSTPAATPVTESATVLDITDRLPEQPVEVAEAAPAAVTEAPERAYAADDTLAVQDRWAMLVMVVVGVVGTIVFGVSGWALGLPQGGSDGIGATAGVGVLIAACILVASIGVSALREDFARFSAGR